MKSNLFIFHIAVTFLLLQCILIVGCQESPPQWQAEEEALFKEYVSLSPQGLGIARPHFLNEFGRHAHQLDDVSLAGKTREISLLKTQLPLLQKLTLPKDSISLIRREAQLRSLQQIIDGEPFLLYEDPVNPISGFHVKLLQTFHNQYLETKEDIEAYAARMKMIPAHVRSIRSLIKQRQEKQFIPPAFIQDQSLDQLKTFVSTPLLENPLYRGLAIKLNRINPTEMNLYQAGDYLETVEENLQKHVLPAYQKLIEDLESLPKNADRMAACWQFPQGKVYYQYLLSKHCGLKLEADSLFARYTVRLDSLQAHKDNKEVIQADATSRKLADRSRIEQIQLFSSLLRNSRQDFSGVFDSLPQRSPEVMVRPQYLDGNQAISFETASLDQKRGPRIVVDFKQWDKLTAFEQKYLLYTQVFPGTHTRTQLAPSKRSYHNFAPFEAWASGWGNYAIQLANRPLYLFESQETLKSGYEDMQARLIALLLTDLGIHAKKWTRDQAQKFLEDNTSLSKTEIERELLKSYTNPGLLVAPVIGAEQFKRLQEYTEVRFSKKINIKQFHQLCLNQGSMPWDLLQRVVNLYGK